jgi:glycosyltransferase involved in cell wall biosynthesis
LLRKPVILNVDGADAERGKWQGFAKTYLRWSEKAACRVADVVIADSPVISERYKRLYGRETVYIPYGANVWPRERETSTTVLERFGLEPDNYVLFVSRLTPENAAHVAIEAHRSAGTGLKLAVVGDAPYSEEYKAYLHSLCDDSVVMTGYLFGEEYRQISCHCRYFVLPSAVDGTRPVLLDQMGFGNCVLVRNTPANMHVIGNAGASFEHEDEIESLRLMFVALSGDDKRVQELRQRALERVTDHFSWEQVTDQYETLFYSLAGHQS